MRIRYICDAISRYMGVIVLLVAVLAFLFPKILSEVRPTIINPLLGLVMFGMGLTLQPADFKVVFSRPWHVVAGCLAQFTVMPLLAWTLSEIFNLSDELALGMILVGCCPGGTASNVITYLAKGDVALSVGMTSVSTLLSPLLTPLLVLLLAGQRVDVNVQRMFMSILWVIILPILLGFLSKKRFPGATDKVTAYLPAFSTLTIALIIAIVVAASAAKLRSGGFIIILAVMLHNLCGLAIGYGIGSLLRLRRDKRVAISIEVGMQNSGLASSLATIHFAAFPLATVPGAIFSVWHNISGTLAARLYSHTGRE